MSRKEERILETMGKALSSMPEERKIYLLGFVEGLAVCANPKVARVSADAVYPKSVTAARPAT